MLRMTVRRGAFQGPNISTRSQSSRSFSASDSSRTVTGTDFKRSKLDICFCWVELELDSEEDEPANTVPAAEPEHQMRNLASALPVCI